MVLISTCNGMTLRQLSTVVIYYAEVNGCDSMFLVYIYEYKTNAYNYLMLQYFFVMFYKRILNVP